MVRGDVHALTQIEAMCFKPLNTGIKIEERAVRLSGDTDEILDQRVAIAFGTRGGVGDQVVNGQLPNRERGVDDSPSCHGGAPGLLKCAGEAQPFGVSSPIDLPEPVLVDVRSQLDKNAEELTQSTVVDADISNLHPTPPAPGNTLEQTISPSVAGFTPSDGSERSVDGLVLATTE
jgi:hypothetical protein